MRITSHLAPFGRAMSVPAHVWRPDAHEQWSQVVAGVSGLGDGTAGKTCGMARSSRKSCRPPGGARPEPNESWRSAGSRLSVRRGGDHDGDNEARRRNRRGSGGTRHRRRRWSGREELVPLRHAHERRPRGSAPRPVHSGFRRTRVPRDQRAGARRRRLRRRPRSRRPPLSASCARSFAAASCFCVRSVRTRRTSPARWSASAWRSVGGCWPEQPGRELVMGAVTRPWEAEVRFWSVPPDEFAELDAPGYAKIVWTLAAEPLGSGESIAHTETRVLMADAAARARFRRYWALVSPGIVLIRRQSLRIVKADAERRFRARARGRLSFPEPANQASRSEKEPASRASSVTIPAPSSEPSGDRDRVGRARTAVAEQRRPAAERAPRRGAMRRGRNGRGHGGRRPSPSKGRLFGQRLDSTERPSKVGVPPLRKPPRLRVTGRRPGARADLKIGPRHRRRPGPFDPDRRVDRSSR